ncbi:MAG: hypothetical protein K2K57_07610 [Oscillospiraceae bacterium]|nr:hypothetical protein [Oscillospiraceae bacterium]
MELTIPEVKRILKENGIPDHYYNLDGIWETDRKICLARAGDGWRVYYTERGKVSREKYFDEQAEACLDVLDRFNIKEFKIPVIPGRLIRLILSGREQFVPVKKDDFMLTALRGIRSFSDFEDAENALGEKISCVNLPVVECDINNLNDSEKLLRLWELAEQAVKCMSRCGRLTAECSLFGGFIRYKAVCECYPNLFQKIRSWQQLTVKEKGEALRLTEAARYALVMAAEDEHIWDYAAGAVRSGYLPYEELCQMAENALLSGNPHPVLSELCMASGEEEALSIIHTENSRSEFATALWQESVIGYYLLLEEEGRISHDKAMGLCAVWCDGYGLACEDELIHWEASGRPDEIFPMKPYAMEMYKSMAKEQMRALRKFFFCNG